MEIPGVLDQARKLKQLLVDYVETPGFARRAERELALAPGGASDDPETFRTARMQVLERMIFVPPAPGRPALLDRYRKFAKGLPDADRAMLDSWSRGAAEGVFKVLGRAADRVVLRNVYDNLTYKVRSNVGDDVRHTKAFSLLAPNDMVSCRVLPIGPRTWTFTGDVVKIPEHEMVSWLTFASILKTPGLAFRNPARHARALEITARNHEAFVELFEGPIAVGTAKETVEAFDELGRELDGYDKEFLFGPVEIEVEDLRRRVDDLEDAAGESDFAEWEEARDEEWHKEWETLERSEYALVHHPVRGLHLTYGLTVATVALDDSFEDDFPHLPWMSFDRKVKFLRAALKRTDIPSCVFELLVPLSKSPHALFAAALDQPGFSWERDGADLLAAREKGVDQSLPTVAMLPLL
ncbi:hypothetical protein [Promicromonospora sp. NPDC023805]|uniref:hypothetical protein n=1 Tax=Promicromonospora sp. NPDC023805 TaxID=3154696 RepID=UPI0033C7EFF3